MAFVSAAETAPLAKGPRRKRYLNLHVTAIHRQGQQQAELFSVLKLSFCKPFNSLCILALQGKVGKHSTTSLSSMPTLMLGLIPKPVWLLPTNCLQLLGLVCAGNWDTSEAASHCNVLQGLLTSMGSVVEFRCLVLVILCTNWYTNITHRGCQVVKYIDLQGMFRY